MKLHRIGNTNATEVTLSNGVTVLFSYSTPVAAFVPGRGILRTTTHYSMTTSRQINNWIADHFHGTTVTEVGQCEIDSLAA